MGRLRRVGAASAVVLSCVGAFASCGNLLGLSSLRDGICNPGSTRPCMYHGTPAKTEGVGTCIAATQACSGDGQSWSTCDGEVDPTAEVCGDNLDNDCDGVVDNGCPCMVGAMSPCYEGPAGTEDAGACHGGMHVCNTDGMTYGACTGQQVPAAETCASTADTNCDGFLCGQTQWVTAFGRPDAYGGVGVDGAGNVYTAGTFLGPMTIGGTTLTGFGGSQDIYVAKFDPTGKLLWAEQFGDTTVQYAQAIAVDAAGNVVVTGSTSGPVDFGGGAVNGLIYVVKLDPTGKRIWSTSCGGSQPPMTYGVGGVDVKLDSKGDVVLVGTFSGTMNCGDAPHTSAGGLDVFVAKLSGTDGTAVWSKTFGDSASQYISAAAVDSGDNITITGIQSGSVNFGGSTLVGGNFYVARFSPSGSHAASRVWPTATTATSRSIVADAKGGTVIVGSYNGSSVNFGGGALPATVSGGNGVFVLDLDSSISHVWSKGFAPTAGQGAGSWSVATDSAHDLVVTGYFAETIDFGGGGLTSPGTFANSMFVTRFDSTGAFVWNRAFLGPAAGYVSPTALALGPKSEIAILGQFEVATDFGTGLVMQPDPGGPDFYLLKLAQP